MAFGIGELGLAPRHLWAMTPRELAAAAGFGTNAGATLDADKLHTLMTRFPDQV